jgi:hypothetical protein
MTRKDYKAFASILNNYHADSADPVIKLLISMIASDMSKVFAADNPRFDADRFMSAVFTK